MRIDLQGAAASAVTTETAGVGTGAARRSAASTTEDKATLSPSSVAVPSLAIQALESAEARFAKVDALQRAVSSGAYTLDPSLIAEALIGAGV